MKEANWAKTDEGLKLIETLSQNTVKINEQHFEIQRMLKLIEKEDHKIVDQEKEFEVTEKHKGHNTGIITRLHEWMLMYTEVRKRVDQMILDLTGQTGALAWKDEKF